MTFRARDAATSAPVSSIAVSTESEHEDLPVKTETPASVAAVPMPDGDGTNASTNIGDAASQGTTGSAEPPRTDSSATATSRGSLSSYAGQTIMLERRGPRHYSMIGVVVPEGFQGEISLLVPAGYALGEFSSHTRISTMGNTIY